MSRSLAAALVGLVALAPVALAPMAAEACSILLLPNEQPVPADGATDVPLDTHVGLLWDRLYADDLAVELRGPDGVLVEMALYESRTSGGFGIYLEEPTVQLEPNTTYEAYIEAFDGHSWSFTTGDGIADPPDVPTVSEVQLSAFHADPAPCGGGPETTWIEVEAAHEGEVLLLGSAVGDGFAAALAGGSGALVELHQGRRAPGSEESFRVASLSATGEMSAWSAPFTVSWPGAGCSRTVDAETLQAGGGWLWVLLGLAVGLRRRG